MTPQKRTGYRWIVLAFIFISFMIAGADRANLGVAVPFMKQEFQLSNTDIGLAASLFFITYAVCQIPTGLLLQRTGVRSIMALGLIFTSIFTLLTGFAANVAQLKLARAALGVAEAPINVGIVTTINRWFPPRERGTAVGIFMASIKFAPAVVPPLAAFIIYTIGWRSVFFLFSVPGFIIAVIWYFFVRDNPSESRFVNAQEVRHIEIGAPVSSQATSPVETWPKLDRIIRARAVTLLDTNAQVVRSWSLWACGLCYGLLAGLTTTIQTWVPTYLMEVKHYQILNMGMVASTPWIGACAGNILGGMMSDRVFGGRRKPGMIISAAATVLTMYGLIQAPENPWALALVFLITGVLLNIGYSALLAYPMGLVAKEKMSFAASIVITFGGIGSASSPFVVGVILDNYSWGVAFAFLAVCAFVTLLLLATMIEPMPREAPATR